VVEYYTVRRLRLVGQDLSLMLDAEPVVPARMNWRPRAGFWNGLGDVSAGFDVVAGMPSMPTRSGSTSSSPEASMPWPY